MIINKEIIYFCIFLVLLCFIIDVKLGLCSTIVFSIFIVIVKGDNECYIEGYNDDVCNNEYNYKSNDVSIVQDYSKNNKNCMSENCRKLNTDPFRTKSVVVNKNMVSQNHQLEGGANPKTRVPPMITRPMYSLDWRANSMIVPNEINGQTNENLYLSGYLSPNEDPSRDKINFAKKTDIIENYDGDIQYGTKQWSDYVNASQGYDPKQLIDSKFPANLPQGSYARNKEFTDYNTNMFTQTVQPGVYYKDNVIEPVNANIGISFQQQFLPRTYSQSNTGLEIVDHDPNFAPPPDTIIEPVEEPNIYNVYDPRTHGYGTSYRNYVDNVTGQARFPYDDINAIKMPNYVVRSKIDTHNFGDTYGPIQNRGINLDDIRDKAQTAFLEDSLSFRNDMMTRLMRKRNAELWQLRQSPLSRAGGSRMMGGSRR